MPFRSRLHKRYLLAAIFTIIVMLLFNTQLQVLTFQRRYTIEIVKTSTPYVARRHDVRSPENLTEVVTEIFEQDSLAADDRSIISYIQSLIHNGALREMAYNLTNTIRGDRSRGQLQGRNLDEYFKNKLEGYFVEIGAGDGESESPTLMLERDRQWNGLLIEPDPQKYKHIQEKGRKAQLLNACVKTDDTQRWLDFIADGKISRTPCFLIESILVAQEITKIDALSIDVDGKEAAILKSFPFKKFPVSAVTVELHGKFADPQEVSNIMKGNDFKSLKLMSDHISQKTDILFVNNKIET